MRSDRSIRIWFKPLASTMVLGLVLFLPWTTARALPAFAQQTGFPCTACHVGAFGPQLTPTGRAFKIGGYTQTGGTGLGAHIPFAAMIIGSFTHTGVAQPTPPAAGFNTNNNPDLDQISVFLAGRASDNIGAFIQGTYSGTDRAFLLDNTDVKLTSTTTVGDAELRYGLSLNNGPTVQDPYNSTFVWMFPFATSALAPTPTAQPLLAGGLVGNAIGLTIYMWLDRRLYAEAGGYESYGPTLLSATGTALGPGSTNNVAPYARLAYEWDWNRQAAHIGGLILNAHLNPAVSAFSVNGSEGRDNYLDYELDGGYQYLGDGTNIVTVDAELTHEKRDLTASFKLGSSSLVDSTLNQIRANTSYFFRNTYGLTLGWQYTWGSPNPLLFPPQPVTGSRNGKPNSNAFIAEADWIPFGKADSWMRPFVNLKIGLQYIAYTLFNGGTKNYDGFGRNASGNNTVFLYVWLAF
jgi:hypothetical protein